MNKLAAKLALASALIALPGVAHAGTSTATGTASLTVINQCTVNGATVNLGTFTASNTWANVADVLGRSDSAANYTAGSSGQEYLNFGSITCDSGTPYTLTIKGTATGAAGAIKLTHNGKVVTFMPGIKKLGGATVADSNAVFAGAGNQVWQSGLAGVGSGAAQSLLGNVTLSFSATGTTALATDTLGVAGSPTDTLTYTLSF